MLTILDHLPEGLLECGACELHRVLPGPTLIHLPGRQPRPLFVSVLLHGNEETGWQALRGLLRDYRERELPRALSLFIGNVAAAREHVRVLAGQPDYNRLWPGTVHEPCAEAQMMAQVVEAMRAREPFASIDIHNNTGLNPHYGCVNRLEARFLHLAALFSRTVVYFIRPLGVQSMAMAPLCPAVTVECGQPGQAHGEEHAREFVSAALHLHDFPDYPLSHDDIDLFHTVATVKVPEGCGFSFGEGGEIDFVEDLDHLNFRELPAGTQLAWVDGSGAMLEAWDEAGEEVARRYFEVREGGLVTRVPLMPSMFTLNREIVRQDCLGYLMERLPLPRLD